MTDEQRETLNARIREIFLANGFTIKEGLDDLKPYVYQAAYALLRAVGALASVQAEPKPAIEPTEGAVCLGCNSNWPLHDMDCPVTVAALSAPSPEVPAVDAQEGDWAPLRIWLQRGMGEEGSHTWCEDQIGEDSIGDAIEEVEYVRSVATPTVGDSASQAEPDSACDPGDLCAGCRCRYNTYAVGDSAGEPDPNDIQGWSVTINVNAQDILTIGHNSLSGIDSIEDFAPVVRNCAEHLLSFIGAAPAQTAEPVAWEMEWPQYSSQGMGYGLEDRGIVDPYDAMRYGWDEAMEQVACVLVNQTLYAHPPAQTADVWAMTDERWDAAMRQYFIGMGDDEGQGVHPYYKNAFHDGVKFARALLEQKP